MKKKKRKKLCVILIVILIVIIGIISVLGLLWYNNYKKIYSKYDLCFINYGDTIEYGSAFSIDKLNEMFIDKDNCSIKKVNYKIENNKVDSEYSFMNVGNINVDISFVVNYKFIGISKNINIKRSNTIKVVDTENPVIDGVTDKNIYVGDNIDLGKNIKCYDKIDGELDCNIVGEVATDKVGTYDIKVTSRDKNENESSREFKVLVKEAPKNNKGVTRYVGKTKNGFDIELRNGIYYIGGILIANKSYPLLDDYNPGRLLDDFNNNFSLMQTGAISDGISLKVVSGFRSYYSQKIIYNNYVARDGQASADTYSARPGYSEHQSGLAADINAAGEWFHTTAEAKWLNDNCYKYGFIIRYPKGKQGITGYIYESWHLRYVGQELAEKLYNNGDWITLEEYLGIDSKY